MARWRMRRRSASRRGRRLRGDRGSMALELSIITPAIVGLLWMMISAGRVAEAASKVEGAARDGARAASINHKGQPLQAAIVAVNNSLQANGVTCTAAPAVTMTTASGAAIPGPGDTVRVTVVCKVALLLGGIDATVSRTGVSVLDTFRGTT
jgi:Flp pilus assembly protein TadG